MDDCTDENTDTGLVSFAPMAVATIAPSLDLVGAFFSGRNPRTLRAYRQDLEDFQGFTQTPSLQAAAALLTSQGPGPANGLALAYRASLQERSLAPATINRRLAALRSLVKLARVLGLVVWELEVEGMKAAAYRDTRGPGLDGFRKMLDFLGDSHDEKAVRDRAIVRLLFGMALRRGEVVSLDLAHLDLEGGRLSVMGKGRTQRESLTIPPKVLDSLQAWVEIRGKHEGPLFTAVDHCHRGHRHAAITEALDRTNGNTRSVQRFSRHKKLETLSLYDDARQDLGGEIARIVDLGA